MSYGRAAGVEVDDLEPLLVRALRDAGDRARALNIVSLAALYYRRALDASPQPDPETVFLHAEASAWAEGVEGGTRSLEEAVVALRAARRDDLAARTLTLLEFVLWESGSPDHRCSTVRSSS